MNRQLGVCCSVLVLAACQSLPATQDSVVGCYEALDGIGYNQLRLCLSEDGSYTSQLRGDIGLWGQASGTWAKNGDTIRFAPRSETEQHVGLFTAVRVASRDTLEAVKSTGESAWEPLERASP